VHSGASSGSTHADAETRGRPCWWRLTARLDQADLKERFLARIALPHRNDVASVATFGPHQHDQPIVEQPIGLISDLAVVLAFIGQRQRQTGKHLGRVFEIQPALAQSPLALGWIVGDFHPLLYPQYMGPASRGTTPSPGHP